MANSVDPRKMARSSHLDLHCLQRYLFWSTGLKRLSENANFLYSGTKRIGIFM